MITAAAQISGGDHMLTLLLSTLGVGGLFTAASIFVPGFLPLALSIAVSVGSFLLRCKRCLVALALFAVFIFATVREHRIDDAKCKAADIAMQLKAAQRDAAINAAAAADARQKLATLETENQTLNGQLADYAKIAHTACPLGARADKLRGIAPR